MKHRHFHVFPVNRLFCYNSVEETEQERGKRALEGTEGKRDVE
jgi:hypothetical protein